MSLTYGAMFAGYGGLELGVQSVLGGRTLWHAEFEKAPSAILAHHYPDVPNLGDVTKVDWASVPKVDVITGGSPCQDLSHAGKRKGMTDGTRSNLWAEMREAVAVIRPRLVVWENVRGALSAPADSALEPCPGCVGGGDDGPVLRALGRVLGDLAELGYDARWYGLRAADVGAPHGRFRIFLFATPADADLSGLEGWWAGGERAGERATGPRGVEAGTGGLTLLPTPRTSDTNGPGVHGDGGMDLRTAAVLLPTPDANMGNGGRTRSAEALARGDHQVNLNDLPRLLPTLCNSPHPYAGHPCSKPAGHGNSHGNGDREWLAKLLPTPSVADGLGGHLSRSGARSDELLLPGVAKELAGRLLPTPRVTQAGYADDGRGGRSLDVEARRGQDWREYGLAIRRWERTLGRPAPAPTEPGAKGQPRLSPRFVEWMMGLPAGWVTDVPDVSRNDMLKALGNGVVPQQCAAATRAFVQDTAEERAA